MHECHSVPLTTLMSFLNLHPPQTPNSCKNAGELRLTHSITNAHHENRERELQSWALSSLISIAIPSWPSLMLPESSISRPDRGVNLPRPRPETSKSHVTPSISSRTILLPRPPPHQSSHSRDPLSIVSLSKHLSLQVTKYV